MKTEKEIEKRLEREIDYLNICVNEQGEEKPEGIDQEIETLKWVLE